MPDPIVEIEPADGAHLVHLRYLGCTCDMPMIEHTDYGPDEHGVQRRSIEYTHEGDDCPALIAWFVSRAEFN